MEMSYMTFPVCREAGKEERMEMPARFSVKVSTILLNECLFIFPSHLDKLTLLCYLVDQVS